MEEDSVDHDGHQMTNLLFQLGQICCCVHGT